MNHKIQCLITSVDEFKDPKLFQQGLALLPDYGSWKERKESISRLRRQESRLESLGAGLMLRTLLLKNSLPLEALSVSEKGKPFLKDHDFHFNLSHSNGYVVCAFGSAPCGIDIQKEREDRSNIARIFFTESEYALVQEHGVSMFTRIWALKESYVKYKGEGLSLPLKSFQMILNGVGFPPVFLLYILRTEPAKPGNLHLMITGSLYALHLPQSLISTGFLQNHSWVLSDEA